MVKKVITSDDDEKKRSSLLEVKKGRHHQLLHQVTPTLVVPLITAATQNSHTTMRVVFSQ